MSRFCFAALGAALACSTGAAAQRPDSLSVAEVRAAINFLSHDSLRGRATPSRGLDAATRWAARRFAALGLRPAGDSGTYLQHYRVWRTRFVPESSTVQLVGPRTLTLRLGHDVDWVRASAPVRGPIAGPVFVLTGTADSTAPFGAHDVRGAVILHLAPMHEAGRVGIPDWLLAAGARAGVAAWILVVDRPDAVWRTWTARIAEPRTVVPGTLGTWPFPVLEVRDESVAEFLIGLGVSQAGVRPIPVLRPALARLEGVTARLRLRERVLSRRTAANVVAVLPGRDSTDHVLVTAHVDGQGVGIMVGGDSIYNGADDNASGVAAVLGAAKLLRGTQPDRTVVFALLSGREAGGWGADYYIEHPALPLERLAAMVTIEAIGRNLPDTLAVIRSDMTAAGPALQSARSAARDFGLTVIDDPWPEARLWRQGDHATFAARGIPVYYLFNGKHADLHQPFDEAARVRPAQVTLVARFLGAFTRALADSSSSTRSGANP